MLQYSNENNNIIYVNKISLLNYGKLIDGETKNVHSASDLLLTMGLKIKYKYITSLGISANYLISSIANYQSKIICMNLGARSKTNNNRLGFGFSIENLLIHSNYFSTHKDLPPTILRNALFYKPLYFPGTLHLEMKKNYYNKIKQYAICIETSLSNNFIFRFSSGWHKSTPLPKFIENFLNSYSLGVGINFNSILLDIGFKNLNSAGYIIGVSINKILH